VIVFRVLRVVVTIPIVFLLPGYVLFKSRLFSNWRMQWLARLLFIITSSVVLTSLVALPLAEIGQFRMWLLDLIIVAVAVAARLLFGNTHRPVFLGATRREVLVVGALVIIAAGFFFRPFEFKVADGDPGYYYNHGYILATTRNINPYDKAEPAMSEQERKTFFLNGISQFLSLHLRSVATGKMQPQLYHMLPVWIGLFIALFGSTGGLYVVPLFALLSILLVFALVRRMTGLAGAAIAAGLMVFFFPELYFARIPVSEVLAQFFLLAAILFFAEYLSHKSIATGAAVAGAVIAASAVRAEALVLLVPLLIVEAVEVFRGSFTTDDLVLTNLLFAGAVLIWLYIYYIAYFYFFSNMQHAIPLLKTAGGRQAAMFVALGFIIVADVLFNLPMLRRWCARLGARVSGAVKVRRDLLRRVMTGAMALVVLGAAVYLYWIASYAHKAAGLQQKFFFIMAGYFGGVVIFVFVVGLCLYIYESRDTGFALLVSFGVVVLGVAFTEVGVTTALQPWLVRRFMTVLVPMLFVGLGYLAGRLLLSRRAYLKAGVVTAVVLLLAFFIYLDVPLVNLTQYGGASAQLKALAQQLDGDLVIFTDTFEGEAFGLPLRYQYGVDARVAYDLKPEVDFAKTVADYQKRGKKVLIEMSKLSPLSGGGVGLFDTLTFTKSLTGKISYRILPWTYSKIPRDVKNNEYVLNFYDVTVNGASPNP
jgi:hypothetical protein